MPMLSPALKNSISGSQSGHPMVCCLPQGYIHSRGFCCLCSSVSPKPLLSPSSFEACRLERCPTWSRGPTVCTPRNIANTQVQVNRGSSQVVGKVNRPLESDLEMGNEGNQATRWAQSWQSDPSPLQTHMRWAWADNPCALYSLSSHCLNFGRASQ